MMNRDGKTDELKVCQTLRAVDGEANNDSDKLKAKYDAKMPDDDKCVNNQDICNKLKNVKTINKSDCNVVIDDSTQSKQQPNDKREPLLPPPPPPPSQPSTYGCVHYKRKAKFVVSKTDEKRRRNETINSV